MFNFKIVIHSSHFFCVLSGIIVCCDGLELTIYMYGPYFKKCFIQQAELKFMYMVEGVSCSKQQVKLQLLLDEFTY